MKKRYLSLLDEIKSNPSKPLELNDHVLVIDGLNNFIRCFSAIPMMSDNGYHVGGLIGFLRSLGYLIKLIRPTRILIVFDGKGGSQKRKKLFPQYKAGRSFKSKLNRKVEFSKEGDERTSMVQRLKFPLVATYEITSSDILTEEYNIHPENFLMYRMIDGDKSDNIDGVRGIALKTLLKICPEISTEPVSLKELVSRDNRLENNLDILKRNFELMQLSDIIISGNAKQKILDFVDRISFIK